MRNRKPNHLAGLGNCPLFSPIEDDGPLLPSSPDLGYEVCLFLLILAAPRAEEQKALAGRLAGWRDTGGRPPLCTVVVNRTTRRCLSLGKKRSPRRVPPGVLHPEAIPTSMVVVFYYPSPCPCTTLIIPPKGLTKQREQARRPPFSERLYLPRQSKLSITTARARASASSPVRRKFYMLVVDINSR